MAPLTKSYKRAETFAKQMAPLTKSYKRAETFEYKLLKMLI
jgi:hypothetical protein